jgi:ABC-2 type transport system ATP-binding protein
MAWMIEASGVAKRFKKTVALDGLDLVADEGKILAVLGPNGAGKTTFVRGIATLIKLDAGRLSVFGHDVAREAHVVRSLIGLAGQFAAVEPALTGRENLEMVARLFGQERGTAQSNVTRVLEQMGLTDDADRLARTYSGGMRRKLDLGASLVGSPRLLLLDEPTAGLDPRSRIDLWSAIGQLVAQGTNVLLTTQYLDEADHLAHEIVIIDHGKAVAQGMPAELKKRAGRNVIEVHVWDREDVVDVANALTSVGDGEAQIDAPTGRITVVVEGATEQLGRAIKSLEECGITIEHVALRPPTLDEVFLALTGEAISDGSADDGVGPKSEVTPNGAPREKDEVNHGYCSGDPPQRIPCHEHEGHRQEKLAQIHSHAAAHVGHDRARSDVPHHLPLHLRRCDRNRQAWVR